MGGFGSSRWGGHLRKPTVEECLHLRVRDLASVPEAAVATVTWGTGRPLGDGVASLGVSRTASAVSLVYAATHPSDRTEHVSERVRLEHHRRRRYFFRCPGCGRRSALLYKPPHAVRFRCRACHGLGYRSRLEPSPRVRLARRLRALLPGAMSHVSPHH